MSAVNEMAVGYLGLRDAMTRAEARAAEDEAAAAVRRSAGEEHSLAHETRAMLADAQYRAKLLNGDTSFDMVDMTYLETLLGIADGMTQRRRENEQVRL